MSLPDSARPFDSAAGAGEVAVASISGGSLNCRVGVWFWITSFLMMFTC